MIVRIFESGGFRHALVTGEVGKDYRAVVIDCPCRLVRVPMREAVEVPYTGKARSPVNAYLKAAKALGATRGALKALRKTKESS